MKRSARLARHYIRAADLRAVYVATDGTLTRIGITREPKEIERTLKRRRWRLVEACWTGSSANAARLVKMIAQRHPGIDRAGVPSRACAFRLPAAADVATVPVASVAAIEKRAAAVVADIEQRVRALQDSGHLRGLNGEYREARAAASRAGRPFMSYGDYLERYKLRMLYQIARAVNG